jgi:hypothetical protein
VRLFSSFFAFFVLSTSAKPMARQVFAAIRFLRDLACATFLLLIEAFASWRLQTTQS